MPYNFRMGRLLGLAAALGAIGCGSVKGQQPIDAQKAPDASTVDARPDAFIEHDVSCKELKTRNPAATTGVYTIDPDFAAGAIAPVTVYCDMDKDGGGWTLAMSLAIDATGLTWGQLVPSMTPPQTPTDNTTNVLDHSAVTAMGITQMMLMGGDRIIKFYYPRQGVVFSDNYRDITEREAFHPEQTILPDAPHTGVNRDACGHLHDACTTTDFALFKTADVSCPRDATNSQTVIGCTDNCGTFGNCPGMSVSPPTPTPNCWFYGGSIAPAVPTISTCPVASQAPWGNYTVGTMTGMYTLWVR
jgi:hypothetical protein